jgi:hypothetical protein
VPLPDESLPGFLLRLSNRLQISPAEIALATGLSTRLTDFAAYRMIELDSGRLRRFAVTARLTVPQASALTLAEEQFRPLSLLRTSMSEAPGWVAIQETWIFIGGTRFCPRCLAGDGSPIQVEHGGAWNKHWRLAQVFACTTHRRLLLLRCPACRSYAHSRPSPTGMIRLVPRPHLILHPLQCRVGEARSAPCPGRFDHAKRPSKTPAVDDLPHLLTLQERFNQLLSGQLKTTTAIGASVTAAEYFAALRATTTLLRAGWTPERLFTSRPALLTDLDQYFAGRDRRARRDASHHRKRGNQHARVPMDPAAGASLLALAAEILDAPRSEFWDRLNIPRSKDRQQYGLLATPTLIERESLDYLRKL